MAMIFRQPGETGMKNENVNKKLTFYRYSVNVKYRRIRMNSNFKVALWTLILIYGGAVRLDGNGYVYWGDRAYTNYIEDHPKTENLD